MSVDLSKDCTFNRASLFSVLCRNSLVSLSFVSLNFFCPGDSTIDQKHGTQRRDDTWEDLEKGSCETTCLVERSFQGIRWTKIQTIRLKIFMHDLWNRKKNIYCLKHNFELVKITEIIIDQSKYGKNVPIINTSSTNLFSHFGKLC